MRPDSPPDFRAIQIIYLLTYLHEYQNIFADSFAHYMYKTNSNRPYPKLTLKFVVIAKLCQIY